jgi:hypothetical protein
MPRNEMGTAQGFRTPTASDTGGWQMVQAPVASRASMKASSSVVTPRQSVCSPVSPVVSVSLSVSVSVSVSLSASVSASVSSPVWVTSSS